MDSTIPQNTCLGVPKRLRSLRNSTVDPNVARARATNVATRRVYGDDIGRAHQSCDRACKYAQSIRNALLITAISGSLTEPTNSKSSVAHIHPCTSATATAVAKHM